jgi:import inner membrane translocase subunit TIM10
VSAHARRGSGSEESEAKRQSRRQGESRVARSPTSQHSRTYTQEDMASLFGGSRASAPAGQIDQARLGEAAMELEAVSDLFTRIVSSCHAKCISTRYAEADLNKGESVCVDRSVPPPAPLSRVPAPAQAEPDPRTSQVRRQVLCRQRKGPGTATGRTDLGTARRNVNAAHPGQPTISPRRRAAAAARKKRPLFFSEGRRRL